MLNRFQQNPPDEIGISSITLAELRYGANKSQFPQRNHLALDGFLLPLTVLALDSSVADEYGRIRAALERLGTAIGPLDTLIAAHALSLGLTLVTNNVGEFNRVSGLMIEDWTT